MHMRSREATPNGNKRVALAAIDVFLQLNGRELLPEEVDAANTMQCVAAGDLTEEQLADWIAAHASGHRSAGNILTP
jgi:death-on-curing protein